MNIKLHKNLFFDILIVLIDALIVVSANGVSWLVVSIFSFNAVSFFPVPIIVFEAAVMLFMLFNYDFYTKHIRSHYEILLSVVISVVVCVISTLAFAYITMLIHSIDTRMYFIVFPITVSVMLGAWKLMSLHMLKRLEGVSKLLVIESIYAETSLARKVKYSYMELYEAWYMQIDVNDKQEIDNLVEEQFKNYESIFISPAIPDKLRDYLISKAVSQFKEIYILPDLYNISVMKNETVQFEDTPALRIKPFGLTKLQSAAKRFVDVFAAFIGIIVTSPLMLVAAVAIKLDSPGTIIYKQERMTLHQKRFNVYKFRTMKQDAEKLSGAMLATEDDPRITRVGKILRKIRMDELPQFFNILFGDMSLVGPRPERPVFIEQYLQEIDNYDKRFFVKAGLTGLAQVYARYDTTAKDKTLYDLLYIKEYSLWLDVKLLLLTLRTVFSKDSAAGVGSRPDFSKVGQKSEEETQKTTTEV